LYYPMAMLICFLLLPGQDRTNFVVCCFFVLYVVYSGNDDISMLAPDRGFYLYYPMAMLICFLLLPGQDRTRRHGE
jgi:hypothetical protein